MPFGAGSVSREQLLLYLVGYLVIFSALFAFLLTAMSISLPGYEAIQLSSAPLDNPGILDSFGIFWDMFTEILVYPVLPNEIMDIYLQIPFIILPKFGIGVILLSYIATAL